MPRRKLAPKNIFQAKPAKKKYLPERVRRRQRTQNSTPLPLWWHIQYVRDRHPYGFANLRVSCFSCCLFCVFRVFFWCFSRCFLSFSRCFLCFSAVFLTRKTFPECGGDNGPKTKPLSPCGGIFSMWIPATSEGRSAKVQW